MTVGRGGGPERELGRQILGRFHRRGIVIPAVFVLVTVATVVGASATTHTSSSQEGVARAALQPSMSGGAKNATSFKHRKALRGHLPKAVKRSLPRELHLKAAHSKVFDVRKLKSVVVKKERPERKAPGYAPAGSRVAEALENPARTAPELPRVIKKSQMVAAAAPSPDASFEGLDFANWGQGHPPDTNGDVGPNYYIETINVSIGIYDKATGSRVAAFTFNSFMSQGNFGNLCDTNNFGDPVVLYDSYEDRWFITDFAFKLDASGNVVNPPGAFQCFAVSKTSDPVNGGWNFYSIAAPGALNDYPKFGVWPDGIYMSANMFGYSASGSYQGFHMWALNKQQMYNGEPSPQVVDFAGDSSDFTVIPANSRLQTGTPPAGSPEYFVSTEQFLNALSIYKFHVDWDKVSTSTFTGPVTAAAPTCWPNSAVTNASTPANAADTLSIRAMAQAQYSNLGGAESLWVDHTVNRGEVPLASCGTGNANNATIRWYQANVTGGTVAANVVQGKTFDPEGANTFFRFMPALAVDRNGDLAITYTKSNSTTNPQIKYAGRLAGDPVNTLGQTEQTLIDGTGAQSGNCGGSACTRWGDYSGMSLDPNGCTFWMSGEYYATTGLNHQTRIGSFHYPGCTTVGNGTLSGTVTDGANPISGATIALGSRTTTTNGSGQYSFSVPAGTYPSLTASKPGFDPGSAATIAVPDGGTATRSFTLGASAQSGCFTDNTQSTFQRGVPSNCDLVTNPGNVQLASPDNTDTKNTNVNPTGFGFTNTTWAGQTFTPTVTGQLKRVDVELFCSGCSGTNPNITVSIRNTTGSPPVPTGADLVSATLPGFNDGAAGGLKTVTFPSPITLTAGTRYAFIFRSTATRAGVYAYTCSCSTAGSPDSNPYANGQRVTSSTSGTSWTADTIVGGRDLNFVTYINPGFASSGTFVSSLKDANPAAGRTPNWTTLSFTASTPAGTEVKFQIAASNSASGPFNFVGPDGTAATFFTTSGASLSQFNGFRYLKYKAYLSTSNSSVTPTLSSVQVCFNDTAATSATSLAADPATGSFGGTTTLSATLTSGGSPVSGKTVAFTLNGSSAGSAVTNASGVASESGVSLAGIDAGTYATGVGASFAGDSSFDPSNDSNSLTVSQADQTIDFPAISDFTWLGGSATLSATASSGLAVSYSVLSGPCSVSGSTLTANHAGSCTVAADQAGNGNYNAASQVTRTATVQKADQAITVTNGAPASAVYNTQFTVAATGGGSGNAVAFSSDGACSNTDSTFTMTSGTGICSVMYDQAGDDDYNAAPQVTESVNAAKADQTINITTNAPASAAYNSSFSVAATAPGGTVSFSSGGSCSNSGATFTITSSSGTCSVMYDQGGDANYNAASQVTESVNAQKADQTINVTLPAPGTAVYNTSFSVAASGGDSGNPVTFSKGGVCTNSGDTFTMTSGTGTCSVKFDQAGDDNYNAAPQVVQSVTAQKAGQTITFAPLPDRTYGDPDFTVSATSDSGLAVGFGASGNCTVTGATVHLTGPGSCTITASQAGNDNYSAAANVPRTFAINSPPAGVSQLTANSACSAFSGGSSQTLGMVEYTAKSGNINKTIPTGFYYWVKVTASAGPNSFTVGQSITTGNFSTQFALGVGSNVFNSACAKKLHPTITAGASGVTATFTAPSAGTYYIGIQYTTSSVKGKPVPSPTTVHYQFSTGGVSGSTSGLDLKQQVPVAAASSARAAMFGALRR
jgi:hypothetical protein